MTGAATYAINGVDDSFFQSQELELSGIAQGYANEGEVWSALRNDSTLVVIDSFSVDRSGDPTFQPDAESFAVQSISATDNAFAPVAVSIFGVDGQEREFTVVGVLATAPSFYGAMMNSDAAADLGYSSTNRYFVRLTEGSDAQQNANAIESALSSQGAQIALIKEQLEESRQATRSVFYLIQGFIALGLFIGIAALGVVTIRAVVERRQQIGVLRAIGFQPGMVEGVFLMEGAFIAGLGTLIGYILALTFSYNLYLQVAADQGLAFLPPWPVLIGIGVSILIAGLITTWLPARSAAKVTIAETLRYE
jgi:putative ABC transport system permease protein